MLKVRFEFRFKGPHYDFKEGHLKAREIANIATGITDLILSGPIQQGFSVKAGEMTKQGWFIIECQQEEE